jgi:hypothetical protein
VTKRAAGQKSRTTSRRQDARTHHSSGGKREWDPDGRVSENIVEASLLALVF